MRGRPAHGGSDAADLCGIRRDRVEGRSRGGPGRETSLDARLDDGPVALEDRLDAPVGEVLHVSVEAERLRLLRALRAEIDALHVAAEDHAGPALHGIGTSRPTERTLRNRSVRNRGTP